MVVNKELAERLFPRFEGLVKNIAYWESIDSVLYKPLVKKYDEEGRSFHDLTHINDCLDEFDEIKGFLKNPLEVELAIWYHDVIYNFLKKDNEEKSAEFFKKSFSNLFGYMPLLKNVSELILTTKDHIPSKNPDSGYLVDIDFYSLGVPFEVFVENTNKIRKEYKYFSDADFKKGRIAFLESVLKKDRVYFTDYFHSKYEGRARDNMKKSIELLSA